MTGNDSHWERGGLLDAIDAALAASGKAPDALTVDDLVPLDQFHGGGKAATLRLARLAGLSPGMRVLDVGGGLGGPARTLAVEFGCTVTVVDLTASYVHAGAALTARVGLAARVAHRMGDALALTDADGAYDVVWTQNAGMNIADKEALYAGFHRVLRNGGILALQEPMRGPGGPSVLPLMWARDAATDHLRTPEAMRATIAAAGFRAQMWDDVTLEFSGTAAGASVHTIQYLVHGDALAEILRTARRNRDEGRIVMVQAVFARA